MWLIHENKCGLLSPALFLRLSAIPMEEYLKHDAVSEASENGSFMSLLITCVPPPVCVKFGLQQIVALKIF